MAFLDKPEILPPVGGVLFSIAYIHHNSQAIEASTIYKVHQYTSLHHPRPGSPHQEPSTTPLPYTLLFSVDGTGAGTLVTPSEWKWLIGPLPRPRSNPFRMPASTYRTAASTASGTSLSVRSGEWETEWERAMPQAMAAVLCGVSLLSLFCKRG